MSQNKFGPVPEIGFSELEQETMQGLPIMAQLLYLKGLCRLENKTDDYGNFEYRVSFSMLGRSIEVHPRLGAKAYKPSRADINQALDRLKGNGLIEYRDDGEDHLIYQLPLTEPDFCHAGIRRSNV